MSARRIDHLRLSRRSPKRRPSRGGGFTLVEMLLVVTIIALLATGLVVSLHGRQDGLALRMSAQDLSESLRYAGARSRRSGQPCRVCFTPDLKRYHVEAWDVPGARFVPVEGAQDSAHELAAGVTVEEVSPQPLPGLAGQGILFGAGGATFSGAIKLRNRAGSRAELRVIAETGQVHVQLL